MSRPVEMEEIAAALAALGRLDDVDEVLRMICEHVVKLLPEAELASVTLERRGSTATAASTSDRATRLEDRQHEAGDGPCLTAARTGLVHHGTVEEIAGRWPEFAAEAEALGVRSFLAAPLAVDDGVHGALNLFSSVPHGFRGIDTATLDLYTTVASTIVRATSRYADAAEVIAQLDRALATRAVIEQAKGILMATHRTTESGAFRRLVERSQAENKKLHLVAEEFVARASGSD
jgi:transcriptional regulator with GAF, ATPase, and Fis domain